MVPFLAHTKKNLQAIYALNTISTIHPQHPPFGPGKSRGRSGVNNHPSPIPQIQGESQSILNRGEIEGPR